MTVDRTVSGMNELKHGPTAEVPNPQDWTDAAGAAAIIGRARATIDDMAARGVLTRYEIGASLRPLFWVPECREVARALARVATGASRA